MGEYDHGVVCVQKTDEHEKVTTVLLGTCRRGVGARAERCLNPWPNPEGGRTIHDGLFFFLARHGEFGVVKLQLREGSFYYSP